jgi:hypothetical protein
VARFRRKLNGPLVWSDKKWEQTCDSLAKLASEVPEIQSDQPNSPVADY